MTNDKFKEAVDDYLETCKGLSIKPRKSFKGTFNVRIDPELHREAAFQASKRNISLNKLVEEAIEHELASRESAGAT
jgi:predicted HicB family RNase H-like nuclease